MDRQAKIYVAGYRGLVGSALVRELVRQGYTNLLVRSHAALDLTRQAEVEAFFAAERPEYVFLSAARVGGIWANSQAPAQFCLDNLLIAANVIEAARQSGVRKLLYLGSSCIYPRLCPQPIREEALLSGPLEQSNEGYAVAKIAGLKLCQYYRGQYGCDFISAMPTNLYGINDSFHPQNSHVLPALLRKIHEAKAAAAPSVTLWGTGTPRREVLYVDDLAEALVFLMDRYSEADPVNVGTGKDLSIAELADRIARTVGYTGEIRWDPEKPDGTPRKLLDVSRLTRLGWTYRTELPEGLRRTYAWLCGQGAETGNTAEGALTSEERCGTIPHENRM